MHSNEIVQPIVVASDGYHLPTIQAAATASLLAGQTRDNDPAWQQWLAGRFTKTVRRVKPGKFPATATSAVVTVTVDGGRAAAWAPTSYENMPTLIRRAQVSGTDLPREGTSKPGGVVIAINTQLGMTTGKAAAQASHAAWLWALDAAIRDPDLLTEWYAKPQLTIIEAEALTLTEMPWQVFDAGLTETTPGSLTAAAGAIY